MKKKNREVVLFILFILLLVIILLNLGIHIVRTAEFNKKIRTTSSTETTDNCSFFMHFRGGASDSWLKRDVDVNGKICTLKGITYDGDFTNSSDYDVSNWKLRINISDSCYLNNCWCGTVEIHQKDKVQLIDLRDFDKEKIILDAYNVGQDFMIPLEKGDYIIYIPSVKDKENTVSANNGHSGTVTIGFIFYTDALQEFNISDYSVNFTFKKGYLQGTEPRIFIILISIWCFVLVVMIVSRLSYKRAKKEAENKLNLQRIEDMKNYNAKLNAEVENKTAHIKAIQEKIVIGLADVIGNRDPDTGGHVNRTSDIIKIVVEEFRKQNVGVISNEKAADICRAAPMHDLGKIYIDSTILCKPGKLTDEEFEKMKQHSVNSGEIVKLILKDVEEPHFVETAYNVARHHHERWDGKGYPDKLSGENIPLEARLMAIADVYDALVSRRCYKQSMSFEKAYDIMCEGMGTQFDPQMKDVFVACRPKLESYYILNNR